MSNYTTSYGSLVNYPAAAQRVGTTGPLLLQDFHHIDNLAHIVHERIPERVVHAKGAGAHGYFKVTQDMSNYTSQPLFHQVDTKVEATVRISTIAGESGSADTARDVHGFSIKLKTIYGNLDWVFLSTPVFFIRDGGKFPDLVHATKRHPQTNLRDPDTFWDFMSSNPETVHPIMMLFSDRGTPDGFHQQDAFSVNTFKWCKADGTFYYVRVHVKVIGGTKTLTAAKATELAGKDSDYGTRKLYEAIENANKPGHADHGKFPEWTVSIQTMTPAEAADEKWRHIALDATKTWPQGQFPLREIGKLILNKNPQNYFDEIEQLAFSPTHLIPYIEPSPEPLLQARFFIYPAAQRYRLGVNHRQLPCNAPVSSIQVANYQRAGAASFVSQGSRPNYQSSTQSLNFTGPHNAIDSQIRNNQRHEKFEGSAYRDFVMASDLVDRDFEQPRDLWLRVWNDAQRQTYVDNVSEHLGLVRSNEIKGAQLKVFKFVNDDLAKRIAAAIGYGEPY